MSHISYLQTIQKYSETNSSAYRENIAKCLKRNRIKIVILDDDPTGIQTVHGCLLFTKYDADSLKTAFEDSVPFFYILTNSRSFTSNDAEQINREVIWSVIKANQPFQYKLIMISRGDSTLRGHFPLEPETILSELEKLNQKPKMPVFFIPSFLEAGRFTINGTHYLKDKDYLIPVAESEFANDNVFGYSNSDLNDYIMEKTNGAVTDDMIGSIDLDLIRNSSEAEITRIIESFYSKKYIITDALDYFDLRKTAYFILQLSLKYATPVVLRTSSSLPNAISGIENKPLLGKDELIQHIGNGIFIVGSHVKKTTQQLEKLLQNKNVTGLEVDVMEVLNNPEKHLQRFISQIGNVVSGGKTPVVYTSRKELRIDNNAERLALGSKISDFLTQLVQHLPFIPSYIVAKGGITSNDILTKGLSVEHARVAGQILTGVPVIRTNKDNNFPLLPYIIFPGNVGTEDSLFKIAEMLI